ncbi:MAG: MGMT family protein [Gemmatimonadales bacterium]
MAIRIIAAPRATSIEGMRWRRGILIVSGFEGEFRRKTTTYDYRLGALGGAAGGFGQKTPRHETQRLAWPGSGFLCTMRTMAPETLHVRIRKVVSRIPRGRVATYGQVARIAGLPGQARLVGYALHALPAGSSVPWQRVVNAKGAISTPGDRQRRLIEAEGVRFDDRNRIPLASFQWKPRPRRAPPRG